MSDENKKFSGELKPEPIKKVQAIKEKFVSVMNHQNATFEFSTKNNFYRFLPWEVKQLPASEIDDPGFKQASQYLSIKGV
jgi:hypothetical protein